MSGAGGAAAISAAGDIIGGGLGLAGSLISTKKAAKYAEKFYRHRYQWQMEDMAKAGLNPILAYQTGAGSPQPPSVPNMLEAFSESARGLAGRASEMMTDVEKREMIGEQQKTERVQQELVRESANKARAEAHAAGAGAVLANERALSERLSRDTLLPAQTARMLQEIEQSKSLVKSQGLMRELDESRLPRSRALGELWESGHRGAKRVEGFLNRSVTEIPSIIQRWLSGPPVEKRGGASGGW